MGIRRTWRQVGVSIDCPLAKQRQGHKSVGFREERNSFDAVIKATSRSSYSNSRHDQSYEKPTEVTINGDSSRSSRSQTPPIELDQYFEWGLMTTMGWITAKANRTPRVRARWTSHRKARRCKRCPTSSCEVDEKELNVNYKYDTVSISSNDENHETNLVHIFKRNHQIIAQKNLRTSSDTSHAMDLKSCCPDESKLIKFRRPKFKLCHHHHQKKLEEFSIGYLSIGLAVFVLCALNDFQHETKILEISGGQNEVANAPSFFSILQAEASLIIGDSAIEIQEIDTADNPNSNINENNNNNIGHNENNSNGVHLISDSTNSDNNGAMRPQHEQPHELIFGSTGGSVGPPEGQLFQQADSMQHRDQSTRPSSIMPGPLPPIVDGREDITDGDKRSRNSHDYELNDKQPHGDALKEVFSVGPERQLSAEDKSIAGKVVDFELTPAGGHNKAKIKKKKKQKKEEEMYKKWGKKKKFENKAMEKKHKETMKKKKEEGKKGKKKWGHEEHGLKKKGNFKKKKWAEKVKKGKGLKKGKKGKKFLKDVGHKNTGFKTVYHKEEWGKSSKWHDIKRQKKWDEKSKKWKNKWKKEKGKKYKGDHMKKFEKKKKFGKKYKKESKDKFKKFKKEKFEKGKKKKMEMKSKKKEGGAKKMLKESKKKKKKY